MTYNPNEPRDERGRWTTGDAPPQKPHAATMRRWAQYHLDMSRWEAALAAARDSNQATPEQQRRFMETMYPRLKKLADELGIPVEWLLGLSAYESGWLNEHNRSLNNPFGLTHGGGSNIEFNSIDAAIAYWKAQFGAKVSGATSPEDFLRRLLGAGYNSVNENWYRNVLGVIGHMGSHIRDLENRGRA